MLDYLWVWQTRSHPGVSHTVLPLFTPLHARKVPSLARALCRLGALGPAPSRPGVPVRPQVSLGGMANVKGFKDVQEENDDEKRQAYYAGGQGQNGGGRCEAASQ